MFKYVYFLLVVGLLISGLPGISAATDQKVCTSVEFDYILLGTLDGSREINIAELSFDRKMKMLMGNTDLLSIMVETYFSYNSKYPDDWTEFANSPIAKNVVLYNPWTGEPLGYSEEFSPGKVKIFGVTPDGKFGFAFHNWESPDEYGGGSSMEFELFVDWRTSTFDGNMPYRKPESDSEWDHFFRGYVLTQFVQGIAADFDWSSQLNGGDICFGERENRILIFSLRDSSTDDGFLSLSDSALPNSISISVNVDLEGISIITFGEDAAPIYLISLAKQRPGFRP